MHQAGAIGRDTEHSLVNELKSLIAELKRFSLSLILDALQIKVIDFKYYTAR